MLNRLIVLAILIPSMFFGQHIIKGTFSPSKDYKALILYKVTPKVSEYITNTEVQEDGSFQLQLDANAKKGMYRIVYASPQEDYNFDVIYNAEEDIELSFNAETGVKFLSSTENKLLTSYTNSMSMITHSIGKFYREESEDTSALVSIFKTQKEAQTNFEILAKGTMALSFIKANKPYIPTEFQDVKTYVANLKMHYFDHVDFNNEILQSSSFLQERMLNYIYGMTNEQKDEITNYKENIAVFCSAMKSAPNETKRILLVDLWQQMIDLGAEPVANYIAETYLIDIATNLKDSELVNTLTVFKNISLGAKAPDFSIEIVKNKNKSTSKLSELNGSNNYVVVFWSSSCSHCLDEIPELKKHFQTKENAFVKVIAIGLEDEPTKWKSLIKEYPSFIHVYGEGKWDNKIGDAYGVTSTPTYFILNKSKEIIAKPENFEALKAYFEAEK